jgi:alpha-glucosidase (family GH31 glycosyl hydrolase)
VAPVLEQGAREREVHVPRGDWIETWSGRVVRGGEDVVVPAPIERVPVWVRAGSIVVTYPATHVAAGGGRAGHERPLEAVQEADADGVAAVWGRHVTDAEYAGGWELPEGRDVTVATR